jgi:SAM-dependent methyltransferase
MPIATEQLASYDPSYFAPLFAAEERHFWFRARNRAIEAVVRQVTADLAPGYRVLEVGCGTGNVLRMLGRVCERGTVVGMDLHAQGLRYAAHRTGCGLVQGDLHAPPFRVPVELIGLFDVLEHFDDDAGVLRALHSMLTPGGRVVMTVPAHAWLWSYFDEGAHHRRRYAPAELDAKLAAAGYQVEYLTPYMASILPLVWLRRWRPGASLGATDRVYDLLTGELRTIPGVNGVLVFLLTQEARVIARRRRLPFGTSLLAVARRATPAAASRR